MSSPLIAIFYWYYIIMENKIFVTTEKQYENAIIISREMLAFGVDSNLVVKILEKAKYYEGVYDLMVLWSEEQGNSEKEAIMNDLIEETLEVEKAQR